MGIISSLLESILILLIAYFVVTYACRILKLLKKILKTLLRIEDLLKPVSRASSVEFYIEIDGILTKVTNMNLKVTQQVKVNVAFKDAKGNVAPVEGIPVWSATAPALVELVPAEDGMSCIVKPLGQIGDLQVQVNADADLGEGVIDIMGFLPVTLLPGQASVVELSAEEPTDM